MQNTLVLMIAGLFDRIFIDWYWVGKTKAWLIPGTEDGGVTSLEIIEYFESTQNTSWITQIENCDWNAAKLLSKLLKNPKEFIDVLGDNGKLFIMRYNDKLVSFATLTQRECIRDDTLYPWIGFVFTMPEYRGNKYSKIVIEHACNIAKKQGYDRVYIATEHAGELYKKYGFLYRENMLDVFGVENQVFYKEL